MNKTESKAAPAPLEQTALGMFMDRDGIWKIAKIKYNGVSGDVGPVEKIAEASSKEDCEHRFKVKVVEEKVF